MEKRYLVFIFIALFISMSVLSCKDSSDDLSDPVTPPDDSEVIDEYDVNLAKGGTVTVRSFNPGEGPEHLIDGKSVGSNSFYSSLNTSPVSDNDHVEWVVVKLSKVQKINEIDIFPVPNEIHEGFPLDFKIQISENGSEWTDVASIKDHALPTSASPETVIFEPIKAGYIRLYAEKLRPINNTWTGYKDVYLLRLAEVEVYLKSSQLKSVMLGSNFGIVGVENQLSVEVNTHQVIDGVSVNVELIKSDGTSLEPKISSTSLIKNNKSNTILTLPARLNAGDYKVKVAMHVADNDLSILSGSIYKITDKGSRTFYVSSSMGNDANDGLSENTSICTLSRASEINLLPGDKLLLKKGDVWEGQKLVPQGNGTPEFPIVISSYGSGDKPHIKPNYREYYGIRIVNSSGYEISDIEISDVIGGIVVWEENTYNQKYIKISNCFLHDMTDQGRSVPSNIPDLLYGMGISIAGSDNYGGKTLLSDVYIENCKIDRCDVGIEVIGRDHDEIGRWNEHGHHKISRFAFMNVNIKDCEITRSYRSGGVMLYCITGGEARNVTVDETGYNGVGMWWGVCAFQVARVSDYLVEECVFKNTVKGTSPDGQGFDWEADNHNVIVKNCRFLNNDGPATLNFGESWPGENDGCILDGCYIEGNNRITDTGDGYYNLVFARTKDRPANNGIVKNCEIHLRTNNQNYSSFPLVFDESNKVYNADGVLIYQGVNRNVPIINEQFYNLNNWANEKYASTVNESVKIDNGNYIYIKNNTSLINYFSEAYFNFTGEGSAGIIWGLSSDASYFMVKANIKISMKSTLQICKVVDGKVYVLRTIEAFGLRPKTLFSLRVNVEQGKASIYSQGNLMGTYSLSEDFSGATGLYMGDVGDCSISRFFVHSI